MPKLDHFEIIAPFYERALPRRQEEQLVKLAGLPVNGILLDAGGGTGRVSRALCEYVSQVVIVDLSLGMLAQAKANAKQGLLLACAHSERLPFPANHFERIIMVDALHHVVNQGETAGDLYRVLKPGGFLVVEEPDVQRFGVKLIALLEKLVLMRSHFLPAERIARLFSTTGARTQIVKDELTAWVVVEKMLNDSPKI